MVDTCDHSDTSTPVAAGTVPGSMTACEYLMLVRQLGRLQQQMTVLVRSYELQLSHWQRQLMRQSVRLMLERTRADWGLVPFAGQADEPSPIARVLSVAQADALICRTGCQMDGDHWRDGDLCKRDSRACVSGTPEGVITPRLG